MGFKTILSSIFYAINVILYVATLNQSKKFTLLLFNVSSNLFFIAHYIVLDAWTGATTAIVTTLFLITVFFLEKYHKEKFTRPVLVVFIALMLVAGIQSWEDVNSLFAIVAGILCLVGIIFSDVVKIKTCAVLSLSFNLVYLIAVKSYLGAVCQVCLIISGIVGIVRNIISKKRSNKSTSQ